MFTSTDGDRVRRALRDAVERNRLPGMSVAVVHGDDLVFAESAGFADIEARAPLRPDHRQRIASITKTMVGLCAMALVDERKLGLEDRIVDLLPDVRFEGPAETMTVRHLMTHTGGIGEAPTVERLRDVANPDPGTRVAARGIGDFSMLYPEGIVIECPPGTKWHYANHGFALLGEIVARAEKAPLHEVMERRIFSPLGMKDSDILDEPGDALATGYHRAPSDDTRFQLQRAGIPVPDEKPVDGINIRGSFTRDFNSAMRGAGGVQSNLPDMTKYASALLRGGAGIVHPQTLAVMMAPQYCPDARLVTWGLTFIRTPHAGRVFIGHGGAYFGGWNSSLAILPDEGVAIVQHMNVMLDAPLHIFQRIWRAVFDAPEPSHTSAPADATILASAPGMYELTPGRLTNFRPATRLGRIRIERDGAGLRLTSRWGEWKSGAPMMPADPADPAFFAVPTSWGDYTYFALTRDADGRVDGLRCDELVYMARRDGAG